VVRFAKEWPMNGLSTAEATERLSRVGPNALPEPALDIGLWLLEGRQPWPIEASAIGVILLLNAGLGLCQEQRSEAALPQLKALAVGYHPKSDFVHVDTGRVRTW